MIRALLFFGLVVGGLPEIFRDARRRASRRHVDNGRGTGL